MKSMKSDTGSENSRSESPSSYGWDKHFFGSVTVGERGQIVIPADARKEFGIEPGDKLLMFSPPTKNGLVICKLSAMREHMTAVQEALNRAEQEMTETNPTRRDDADVSSEES